MIESVAKSAERKSDKADKLDAVKVSGLCKYLEDDG